MYVFIVKPINKRKWNYQQKVIPRRNAINKNICWGLYEYQWEWIECVSLKISYHLYLLRISYLSFECVTSTGQRSKFRVKNATICLQILFFYCCCFSLKNCVFIILISFFGEVSNFCNRILTNQKPGLVIKNWRWKCMDTIQWIQCRNHYVNSIRTLTVMIPETMPPAICCKKTHFQ